MEVGYVLYLNKYKFVNILLIVPPLKTLKIQIYLALG